MAMTDKKVNKDEPSMSRKVRIVCQYGQPEHWIPGATAMSMAGGLQKKYPLEAFLEGISHFGAKDTKWASDIL